MQSTLLFFLSLPAIAALDIKVSSAPGNATSGHQYGFLHEDINNSGDGGLYAELLLNRAFQSSSRYPESLAGWSSLSSSLTLENLDTPLSSALPTSMRVAPDEDGEVGFENAGYWGISVKRQEYRGSFWVKGEYNGIFNASLKGHGGEVWGWVGIDSKSTGDEWVEHEVVLTPTVDAPDTNNTFAITFDSAGLTGDYLDFNLISLFPPTWKSRPNGLRPDLAQVLADLKPRFFRFPGGNMLEGNTIATRWDWKNSLGPLKDRPGFPGVWGYQQTNGLGLKEYLDWSEDMGTESVLAVWSGLALDGGVITEADLQPYIDDALDELEFVLGNTSTQYGALRASLGHLDPYPLTYVEIGNEDWLEGGTLGWTAYKTYRFPLFQKAILSRYPNLTVISSGSTSDGFPNIPQPAMADYHLYDTPDGLVSTFSRFDHENISHIIGEVAAVHPNGGTGWNGAIMDRPWWIGSVAEAIAFIGYERNADRVKGTFYAPIIRNLERSQWTATMVQFAADPARTTRSTSWYVWRLLASKQLVETRAVEAEIGLVYGVAGIGEEGERVWKGAVYNMTNAASVPVALTFEGVAEGAKGSLTVLSGPEDPYGVNTETVNVVKEETTDLTAGANGIFEFELPQWSVALFETSG